MSSNRPTPVDAPPPQIPGLTIRGKLGGGGFATVYEAWQERQDRAVAVKVLKGDRFDAGKLLQFEAEARIMGRVSNHPSIVTIFDANVTTDGRPYLVMELYNRGNYARRAAGGALRESEVLRVGVNIASAVETAHRAGIIHRDIKPENVLINEFGNAALTDFGISSVSAGSDSPDDGAMTIPYAAPELLSAKGKPSVESDVYSLAATLWALLTGHPPYHGGAKESSVDMMRRILSSPVPVSPRSGVHPRFVSLLRQALDKNPEARPPSAVEFAQSLRRVEMDLGLDPTPLMLADGAQPSPLLEPPASPTTGTPLLSPPSLTATSMPLSGVTVVQEPQSASQPKKATPQERERTAPKPKNPLLVASIAVVALAAGGVGAVLFSRGSSDSSGSSTITTIGAPVDVGDPAPAPTLTEFSLSIVDGTHVQLKWSISNQQPTDSLEVRRVDAPNDWSVPKKFSSSPVDIVVDATSPPPCFEVRPVAARAGQLQTKCATTGAATVPASSLPAPSSSAGP